MNVLLLLFHRVELIRNIYLNGTLVQMLLGLLYRLKSTDTSFCEVFCESHDAYLAPFDSRSRIGAFRNAKHEAFTPKDIGCSLYLMSICHREDSLVCAKDSESIRYHTPGS